MSTIYLFLPTPSFSFSSPVAWPNPSPKLHKALLQMARVTSLLQPRRLLPVVGSHLPNPKTVLADEAFPRGLAQAVCFLLQ